ncbi:hypothetical protein AVEN_195187-1 [Araneus ventricosus]|uniref:Uncharacterized protein n=1 Tax=Araneus ventricosus TaxID=182803 RepID=A0A4Y2JCC2_ARAVE|nr:hypothetical protein AVEN_195187-1 [Araneus ventricosus]
MPAVTNVSKQVEDFYILSFTTSEHHTDATDSRILRDNEKLQKLVGWFEFQDPFAISAFVISISTGILKDETINCNRTFECGNYSMSCIVGKSFCKKKMRVTSLRGLKSKVNIGNEEIHMNP